MSSPLSSVAFNSLDLIESIIYILFYNTGNTKISPIQKNIVKNVSLSVSAFAHFFFPRMKVHFEFPSSRTLKIF